MTNYFVNFLIPARYISFVIPVPVRTNQTTTFSLNLCLNISVRESRDPLALDYVKRALFDTGRITKGLKI